MTRLLYHIKADFYITKFQLNTLAVISFFVTVVGDVVCHFIVKWLE